MTPDEDRAAAEILDRTGVTALQQEFRTALTCAQISVASLLDDDIELIDTERTELLEIIRDSLGRLADLDAGLIAPGGDETFLAP